MRTEWVVLAVLALIAVYAIVVFNRLIRGRNLVREGFSGIDVQLRRRSDLVPNLVETVKAYAAHERNLFNEIAAKRTAAMNATGVSRQGRRRAGPARLAAAGCSPLAEAYPELKANQNFLGLQNQIAELEDQLQMARRYYNGTVRDFNIGIQSFPDVLLARATGFHEEHFFQADADAAANPSVTFPGS